MRGENNILMHEKIDVLTVKEVSEELQVTEKTVRKLINDGQLKGKIIGKGYRITREDLNRFLES